MYKWVQPEHREGSERAENSQRKWYMVGVLTDEQEFPQCWNRRWTFEAERIACERLRAMDGHLISRENLVHEARALCDVLSEEVT